MNFNLIIEENKLRHEQMKEDYDPAIGIGSPIDRFMFNLGMDKYWLLPMPMMNMTIIKEVVNSNLSLHGYLIKIHKSEYYDALLDDIIRERLKHDFEFWALTQVEIQDKISGEQIPFKLNRPQRKLLKEFERQRLQKNATIRVIIDKARQWGGSTLTQIYENWLQIEHYTGWNSAIVSDLEEQARTIRAFQTGVIEGYKIKKLRVENYEGSPKNKGVFENVGTDVFEVWKKKFVVSIASMQNPHSLRSKDIKLAHLSETAFWHETQGRKPRDIIRSIRGTIKMNRGTMIVLESTANGVGNFFHNEWLRSIEGKSAYTPFFAGWQDDERNQMECPDPEKFVSTWKDYEWYLWRSVRCTIEQIYWYKYILDKEYGGDLWSMYSENPTNWEESFQSTGRKYIPPQYVSLIDNEYITDPVYVGDFFPSENWMERCLENLEFCEIVNGNAYVWALPDTSYKVANRYVVIVDVGGKSQKADWNVIRVLDRYWLIDGGVPEFIFTWMGHLDPDLVAWKAMQVAKFYDNALLVIESNYFESRSEEKSLNQSLTVINLIAAHYDNIYIRTRPEKIVEGAPIHYGFHMNKQTKPLVYATLLKFCRNNGFIEHDRRAIFQMKTLIEDERGRINAEEGCHDDITDTMAIGLYISEEEMYPPKEINVTNRYKSKKPVNEASFR